MKLAPELINSYNYKVIQKKIFRVESILNMECTFTEGGLK